MPENGALSSHGCIQIIYASKVERFIPPPPSKRTTVINMSGEEQDVDRYRSPSFDLTLEHQLEVDSLPSSPVARVRPQSVDTHVLASVITQLRTSLADVTRERDELTKRLDEFEARETDMKDALADLSGKCAVLQDQLDKANDKTKEDESTISVLRSKVEESRYVALPRVRPFFER